MEILQVLSRWIHIVSGIMWIGLLYYYNFVHMGFAPTMDPETAKKVVPELVPRSLYWFRWGALWTWVSGVLLLLIVFYHGGLMFDQEHSWSMGSIVMIAVSFLGVFVYDSLFRIVKSVRAASVIGFILILAAIFAFINVGNFEYRAYVIHTGVLFGTIMAFNVWFRIWPSQQKVVSAIKEGKAPDQTLLAHVGMRSRHNTYLSIPLIWLMINSHHAGTPPQEHWLYLPIFILAGWVAVYLLYQKVPRVKGF
ncbi:MAG: urate hydroxylase PuuD [Candidatus Neomarinimicrobiota bacterium]